MSTITQAEAEDIQEVLDLLERCHLPQEGLYACLSTLVVAPAIHQSVEWTSACPANAQAMVFELGTPSRS